MSLSRRLFLIRSAALAASVYAAPGFTKDPFSLGVMSGDPSPDGFVLWTRLAPEPLNDGGMGAAAVEVQWIVAEDDAMRHIVKKGKTVASPALAHSVHVEVQGLKPQRPYWYRFKAGPDLSPIGRAITSPKPGVMQSRLKFAFASCQHWEAGWWTAYEHMLADNPDLVVHLGDYIYEGRIGANGVRKHNSAEIVSLSDYRNRHALYKTDPGIQKMHAHCPWILTWDDHEVDNNYAGDVAGGQADPPGVSGAPRQRLPGLLRAHAARISSMPQGSKLQLYRKLQFGELAEFSVLDTRQYRTDQPCNDGTKAPCEAVFDPSATILGDAQESWLKHTLAKSRARWNIIANQVLMARIDSKPGPEEALSMDQWSGYEVCRDRMMQFPGRAQALESDRHHRRYPFQLGKRSEGRLEGREGGGGRHRIHRHFHLLGRRRRRRAARHRGLVPRESASQDVQQPPRVRDGHGGRGPVPRRLPDRTVRDQTRRTHQDAFELDRRA